MDQRFQQYFSIKLHFKNGIATVALHDDIALRDVHTFEKTAANLHEVFTLYKAYERFIGKMGWHMAADALAEYYGINTQEKSINQVVNEIGEAQQKELKELDADV